MNPLVLGGPTVCSAGVIKVLWNLSDWAYHDSMLFQSLKVFALLRFPTFYVISPEHTSASLTTCDVVWTVIVIPDEEN